MASTIKHKRSEVAGSIPALSQLSVGEIALNLPDRKIYTANSTAVFSMGGADSAAYNISAATDATGAKIILGDGDSSTTDTEVVFLATTNEIDIGIEGGNIKFSLPNTLNLPGSITAGTDLASTGNTGVQGKLTVQGVSNLNGVTTNGITANGAVDIRDTTAATNETTGALKVAGGASVQGDFYVGDDLDVAGDAVIDGNLTVNGDTTYFSTSTVYTDDGMFKLSSNNIADAVDTGIYAKYVESSATKYAGYFRDATDGHFKFFEELTVEPGVTVNTAGAGYALAQVDCIIDGGTY